MELPELMDSRYSVRRFKPEPIARPIIEDILTLAGRSASWCNTQPWQLHVTEGEATDRFRDALWEHVTSGNPPAPDIPFPTQYQGAHYARRKTCALQLYRSLGIKEGDRQASQMQTLENFKLFGAPHVVIVTCHESLGAYGALDCGLFVNGFLLAATHHGIGSIAQAALAAYSDFIHQHFAIPDEQRVLCAISFGHTDDAHPANQFRTERAPLDELVTWV
ncbi:MAG: nitroreductase [Pseudomonadota bacterium]|jgi:nitroreductase|nr:nitroreductase [Pseudomonadota bacterium]